MTKPSRAQQNQSAAGQTSLHFGRVSAINTDEFTVRVRVDELGSGFETFWLRTIAPIFPEVGALVAVWLQNDGSGGVACALNNEQHNRSRVEYSDGTIERYEEGDREILGPTQMTIVTDAEFTAEAGDQMTLIAGMIDLNP